MARVQAKAWARKRKHKRKEMNEREDDRGWLKEDESRAEQIICASLVITFPGHPDVV